MHCKLGMMHYKTYMPLNESWCHNAARNYMSLFSLHKIKYCSSSWCFSFPIMLHVMYFSNYKRSLSVKVNWSCVCFLGNVQYCGVQTAAGNNHYTSHILFSDREDWESTQAFKAVFAQSKQSRLHYQPGKTPMGSQTSYVYYISSGLM